MSNAVAKICCMCNKDVSSEKHGKDKRGRYYCLECFETAKKRAAAATSPTSASPMPAPPPQPAAATDAPLAMPEFCPGCGAKVFANRKRCMKCGADIMQLVKKAAARPKDADRAKPEDVIATWVGRTARVGLVVGIVGVVLFILYGYYIMFMPGGLWDNYPKTREAAVREFLGYIADGSDKSYDKAFMLISFRERSTGRSGEDQQYKNTFTRMHDDFAKKYGNDWLTRIKLDNLGSNDKYADDEVDYKLTLGKDSYIIATQAQMDTTKATANMTLPRKKKPVYNEDGKHRFGILDVSDYLVHEQRHMIEIAGNGQPETFDPNH